MGQVLHGCATESVSLAVCERSMEVVINGV
jgi:hypothetical protein